MTHRLVVCAGLLSVLWASAFCQRFWPQTGREGRDSLYERPQPVYFEAVNLISGDSGRCRLDVGYRIARSFFVFVRDTSRDASSPFVARVDIAVEVMDSNNTSVARRLESRELRGNSSPEPPSESELVEGIVSFSLPPGAYTIVSEVSDRESDRKFFDNSKQMRLPEYSQSLLALSDIVLINKGKNSDDSLPVLHPLNFGGHVPFGRDFGAYAEIACPLPKESLLVSYRVLKSNPESKESAQIVCDTIAVSKILDGSLLSLDQKTRGPSYRLLCSPHTGKYGILLGFRGDTLQQGRYQLELSVRAAEKTRNVTKPFRVSWVAMPRSLMNLDVAVDALEYVMTKEEFKSITRSPLRDRRRLFEEFWKRRDPTPGTAFNEAMAEYYRRVDDAMTSFATVVEFNGAKTERGKAYILYGPPTRTERSLLPNEPPRETWYYESLKKKLVFVDEHRRGDYKLVAEEQLPAGK